MRMMLRIHLDANDGSKALKSGAFQKAIGAFTEKYKPEATYFSLESGKRTGFFVFDMNNSQQCPEVAEAFFDLGCDLHLSPCMTGEALRAGVASAGIGEHVPAPRAAAVARRAA